MEREITKRGEIGKLANANGQLILTGGAGTGRTPHLSCVKREKRKVVRRLSHRGGRGRRRDGGGPGEYDGILIKTPGGLRL